MSKIIEAFKATKFLYNLKQLGKMQPKEEDLALAQIAKLLESEKALFLKMGQFLGLSEKYQALFDKSYHFSSSVALPMVEQEFQKNFGNSVWEEFELYSDKMPSASLAQVVYLKEKATKQIWVMKFFLPGVKEKLEEQLSLLKMLPNLGPQKKWGIDIADYKRLLQSWLDNEMDYLYEQKQLKKMGEVFASDPLISIPCLHTRYLSKTCYLQSYAVGRDLSEFYQGNSLFLNLEQRSFLAKTMVHFFAKSFFIGHQLQLDGNWGNFRIAKEDHQITSFTAIDFGSSYEFSSDFVLYSLRLLLALKNNENLDCVFLLGKLGFDVQKMETIEDRLPALLDLLLEPFVSDKVYDLRTWDLEDRMDLLLGDLKWWFRSAGSPAFFSLMRSLKSLLDGIRRLNVNISFHSILEKNYVAILHQVIALPVEGAKENQNAFSGLAKNVEIRVVESGKEKVKLHMPLRSLIHFEDYMEDDLKQKLKNREIDYRKIIDDYLASPRLPELLFSLKEEEKEYLISTK